MSVEEVGVGGWEWERPTLCLRTLELSLLFKYSSSYLKSLMFMYVCSRNSHQRPVVQYLNIYHFLHGLHLREGVQVTVGDKMSLDHGAPTSLSPSPVLATYRHKGVWEAGREMLS